MGSVFDPSSQHGDVDAKIVAALERLGQVFRVLLREKAQEHKLSPIQARFLVYLRWPEDGRVMTLRLTPEGELLAAELSTWADMVREHLDPCPSEEKEVVMRFLMRLIGSLQGSGVITVARMCVTCRFFRRDALPGAGSPHHCGLLDVPLSGSDLRIDCQEHELAGN